jgi:hypothetical protein
MTQTKFPGCPHKSKKGAIYSKNLNKTWPFPWMHVNWQKQIPGMPIHGTFGHAIYKRCIAWDPKQTN